jgi:hypothetical protein
MYNDKEIDCYEQHVFMDMDEWRNQSYQGGDKHKHMYKENWASC